MRSQTIRLTGIFIWYLAGLMPLATAQERYELSAPHMGAASQALIDDRELQVVSSDGQVTSYTRELRFDSSEGQWLGYYSRAANQVLRWPSSNSGNLQIGEVSGGSVRYRYSQMSIRPIGGVGTDHLRPRIVERPVLPPLMNNEPALQSSHGSTSDFFGQLISGVSRKQTLDPRALRIATYDTQNVPHLLTRGNGWELAATADVNAAKDWWFAPAGAGLVRVQAYDQGHIYAVSAQSGGRVSLMPLTQDPRQLWRVTGAGRIDDRYVLENAHYPGTCLSNLGGGRIAVQPINFAPTQLWVPIVPPPMPNFQPFYRTVSQEVHANPQLPAAQVELTNTHRNAILLLLGDIRQGNSVQQIRIEPNSSQVVALDRDSGSTIIETVETLSPLGGWERQQFVTTIPPSAFYDISVYEEHLQSIAIDRTGKSPNPIEDVNYVPKSVGWFPMPAGTALPANSRMDVYRQAVSQNNPGAVRRLDPKQFDEAAPSDRLEQILQEFQPAAPRRKF